MKKSITVLSAALILAACTHTAVLNTLDTNYTVKALPAQRQETYYNNGFEYVGQETENTMVGMNLSDAGKTFWLDLAVATKTKNINIIPQENILLFAVGKDGNLIPLKQYTSEDLQKDFEREANSRKRADKISAGLSGMGTSMQNISANASTRSYNSANTVFQDRYGRNIGTATTYYNENNSDAVALNNAVYNSQMQDIRRQQAASNYGYDAKAMDSARLVDGQIWKQQTLEPGITVRKLVFFKVQPADKYIIKIKAGSDEYAFEFERVKKE